jgi:hypothetical protein
VADCWAALIDIGFGASIRSLSLGWYGGDGGIGDAHTEKRS